MMIDVFLFYVVVLSIAFGLELELALKLDLFHYIPTHFLSFDYSFLSSFDSFSLLFLC